MNYYINIARLAIVGSLGNWFQSPLLQVHSAVEMGVVALG